MRTESFKVKVLDLNVEQDGEKYETLYTPLILFEGNGQFAVFDSDGCGQSVQSNETVEIYYYNRTDSSKISIVPDCIANLNLEQLKEIVVGEMEAVDAIRYNIMLKEAKSFEIDVYKIETSNV